jgi:two-component system chemotaxis response regulator CheB
MKLLVADDSPIFAGLITYITQDDEEITIVGYAEDGIQAIQLTKTMQPNLIIMDIHMPRMGGIEAIERIMESNPTPIIVITTDFTGEKVSEALAKGALKILDKPSLEWDETQRKQFCNELKYLAMTTLPRHI